MNFVKLYKLIANNFQKDEIDVLAISLGLDPENIFPGGSNKTINASRLVDACQNRGLTLRLLGEIHEKRPNLALSDYLYLAMVESQAFLADEIRDLYVERYADSRGLYTVTNTTEQAQQVQAHFQKEGNAQAFYELVEARFPQISSYPFLKPGFKPTLVTPPKMRMPGGDQSDDAAPAAPQLPNFDIIINPMGEAGVYNLSATVSDGSKTESTTAVHLPSDDTFNTTLLMLQSMMVNEEMIEALGSRLYDFLFPTAIQQLYIQAKAKHDKLRVRVMIPAELNELHQIPWEYVRTAKGYIATSKESPLVRYLAVSRPEDRLIPPNPLKILLAVANPSDQKQFDADAEIAQVEAALADLIQSGSVELKIIPKTGRRELRVGFEEFKPHVLHFIGHGGENALVLQSRRGTTQLVDAEDMMSLVRNHKNTRLVILAACQTSRAAAVSEAQKQHAGFLGVGPRIVWGGVPAVIAMQTIVPMDTAFIFVQEIYDGLARGYPLDTAVTLARFAVYFDEDDKVYWGIPVLFMRSPDGNIW